MKSFTNWLDTLISEKGIDLGETLEIAGPSGQTNFMPVSIVIDAIKQTTGAEQTSIKDTLVKIDFANGDIMHFINHLAKSLAI